MGYLEGVQRPGPGPVPRNPGGIQSRTLDATDCADVLDLVTDGREGWRILPPPPFPGIPWGNPRQYFVPRGIQCGGGCCDMTPGDGGGANVSGIGGIQIDYSEIGGIFLCGRRVGCIAPDGEVIEGFQRPHIPLQLGMSSYERT